MAEFVIVWVDYVIVFRDCVSSVRKLCDSVSKWSGSVGFDIVTELKSFKFPWNLLGLKVPSPFFRSRKKKQCVPKGYLMMDIMFMALY